MADERSLDALLLDVAVGGRAAFNALFLRTSPKLHGIALRICGDRAMAEDVLQEVFAEVWRRAGRFDPRRGGAMAWLAILTRSRAIDAIRRRGRGDLTLEDTELMRLADLDPGFESDPGDLGALLDCLKRLDPVERTSVLLAYCEGYSREELAARFDSPVNTVKTRLRRALIKLRGCLEQGEAP